mmetsp:Transcript_12092/g.26413  ORF Transcript_12092/g.26413 Transcript_12092/m.26413 type:complete len:94 (-) Transcript_12092:33-314(-)
MSGPRLNSIELLSIVVTGDIGAAYRLKPNGFVVALLPPDPVFGDDADAQEERVLLPSECGDGASAAAALELKTALRVRPSAESRSGFTTWTIP